MPIPSVVNIMYFQKYPRAEVEYTFFDRNKTVYPKRFRPTGSRANQLDAQRGYYRRGNTFHARKDVLSA